MTVDATVLPLQLQTVPAGTVMEYVPSVGLVPIIGARPQDMVPGQSLYGGATITRKMDAARRLHIGVDARDQAGDFRFRTLRRNHDGSWVDLPLQMRCTGRGTIDIEPVDGLIYWIAWEKNQFFTDVVPECVPLPVASQAIYVPLVPMRYSPAANNSQITGEQLVDMSAMFGLEIPSRAYNVRLVGMADRPGVRIRLGASQNKHQLTVCTQAPNIPIDGAGIVNAQADAFLWLSVIPENVPASVWIQLAGFWPAV